METKKGAKSAKNVRPKHDAGFKKDVIKIIEFDRSATGVGERPGIHPIE